jgi:hypothetical protein
LPEARQWIESPVPLAYTPYREAANAVVEAARASQVDGLIAWWDQSEQIVAACMKEEGFEYYPTVYTPEAPATDDAARYGLAGDILDVPWLPSTRAEVERVGYGALGVSEVMGSEQFESDVDDPAAARNEEYLASLSDTAREAYYFALAGLDPVTGEEENPDSCRGRAWTLQAQPEAPNTDFLEPLNAALAVGSVAISVGADGQAATTFPDGSPLSSPEMSVLAEEFGLCVSASPVVAKYDLPIRNSSSVASSPLSLFSQAVAISPDGDLLGSDGGQWAVEGDIADEKLSLVGSVPELEIALLDFDCRAQTDYVARYAAVMADAEASYVAEHQAEFDAMMAQIEDFLAIYG